MNEHWMKKAKTAITRYSCVFIFMSYSVCSLAGEKSKLLKASLARPISNISVNDRPTFLIKIRNVGNSILYLDHNEIYFNSAITYPDGSIDFSTIVGAPSYGVTDGGEVGNMHLGSQTIGIEPGQSILKLVQIPQVLHDGVVTIYVSVQATAIADLAKKWQEWKVERFSTEFSLTVKPTDQH
jgi:hypothetical protein